MPLPKDLPPRRGPRPRTTPRNPHTQLDQNAPTELQDRLRDRALALPGVRRGLSNVSVPGAVAFFLDEPVGPLAVPDLFGGEWGHIHPSYDGSLHLNVPTPDAERLIVLGWAEYHNVVTSKLVPPVVIMLYGPRDEHELSIASLVAEVAHLSAGGAPTDEAGRLLGTEPVVEAQYESASHGLTSSSARSKRDGRRVTTIPLPSVLRAVSHAGAVAAAGGVPAIAAIHPRHTKERS